MKSRFAIFERFSFEGLYNIFLGLPPRNQLVVLIVVGVIFLLVVILPVSLASGKLSQMEKRISEGREEAQEIVRELDSFNQVRSRLGGIESVLRGGADVSLSTAIESLAAQVGIKDSISSIKERAVVPSALFDELGADVTVGKITLDQMVDFLTKVEQNSSRVMRVRQLQIKPRYDNRSLLDVSVQVATYRLSGEGG